MSCTRCRGLMVAEYALVVGDLVAGYPLVCWRCLNCGELLDNQILVNRQMSGSRASVQPASASPSRST